MSSLVAIDDVIVYVVIGIITFVIGLLFGHLVTGTYYQKRFIAVANECSDADSLVPLISELERES